MKPNWSVTTYFRYNYYAVSSVFESYQKEMPKIVGFPFNYGYENSEILYDEHNFDRHVKSLKAHPDKAQRQIDFIKTASTRLLAGAKKYGKKKDFHSFFAWDKEFLKFLPTLGIVVGLERYLADELAKFLSAKEIFDCSLSKETQTAFEQRSLLKIAASNAQGPKLNKQIERHLKRFAWLGNKIMSYAPFQKKDILRRIKTARKDAEQRLKDLEKNRKDQERALRTIIKRSSEKQRKFIGQYRDLLYLRTARAEAISLACELTAPLFSSIASQLNMNREQLMRFSAKEMAQIHPGKLKLHPNERKHFYAYLIDGKEKTVWGTDGRKTDYKFSRKEFSGIIANQGVAVGKVRLVMEIGDVHKVRKGDIMVAPSTNPNMIIALEKAGAIVTDAGSLSSHTAIVSRELGVPCLVATKIATKVLKDGNTVKVDANKGIVTILKS